MHGLLAVETNKTKIMKALTKEQDSKRIELITSYVENEKKFIHGGYIKPYVQILIYAEYMELTGQDMREDEYYQDSWKEEVVI